MNELKKLWDAHIQVKFPKGYAGTEVEGIDLMLLDTFTSGCISTFLDRNGNLDLWRTAILGVCYRDLAIVNRELEGDVLEYFILLENMAKLVLQGVIRNSKSDV
jgi:hypothetical protein